jgi:hypothetical protein
VTGEIGNGSLATDTHVLAGHRIASTGDLAEASEGDATIGANATDAAQRLIASHAHVGPGIWTPQDVLGCIATRCTVASR